MNERRTPDTFTPGAISKRIAGLNHKSLDNSMEDDIVVVVISAMHAEVLHRARATFALQTDVDVTQGGSHDSNLTNLAGGCRINLQDLFVRRWFFIENITTEPFVVLFFLWFSLGEAVETLFVVRGLSNATPIHTHNTHSCTRSHQQGRE